MRRIIGPCASGALTRELELGDFIVCDQYVDRTRGRADTFYDGPETTHVSAADPFCPDLRRSLVETARERAIPVREGGHGCRHPGPALLDSRGVGVVSVRRMGRDQHDGVPGVPPRPRAGALLRRRSRWSRTTTSASPGRRPFRPRRSSRCCSKTTNGCAICSSPSSRRSARSRTTSARQRCGGQTLIQHPPRGKPKPAPTL